MKTRIISALVALAIIIPFAYLGGYPFAGLVGVISVLGYKELLDLKESHNDYPIIVKILGLLCLLFIVVGNFSLSDMKSSFSFQEILLPLVILLLPTVFYKDNKYTTKDAIYLIGMILFIGILFNLLIAFRINNPYVFLYLLSVTILTDTFAYSVGMLIGKHKMIPSVSPKKSWEGAIGGLIGGSIISLIIYANLVGKLDIKIIIVTFILSIMGQIGDLVFSKIKRENDIKDFSNIMPGHGGVLDRIDSLTFVIFTYVLIYFL